MEEPAMSDDQDQGGEQSAAPQNEPAAAVPDKPTELEPGDPGPLNPKLVFKGGRPPAKDAVRLAKESGADTTPAAEEQDSGQDG
jgi:hypothetical protein